MIRKLKSSIKLYLLLAMAVFVFASFFVISLLNHGYARSIDKQITPLKQINISDSTNQSLTSTDMVVGQAIPVSQSENLPEKSPAFEDWRPGNYQPLWLANDNNCRQMIDKAIYQGLIRGYDRNGKHYLKLSQYMTRAEYAVLLARVLNLEPDKTKKGEWYLPYTSALTEAGIVSEDNWSSTEWNQYIKRMEMAQWTGKSLLINKYQSGTREIEGINSPEIRTAILSGLINGDDKGNYNWQNSAERVHGIIVLMKLQQVLMLPPPVSTGDDLTYGESALRTITISAIGDCTLGTDFRFPYVGRFDTTLKAVGNDYSYFFNNVRTVLENDELTIANLETTLTTASKQANKGDPDEAYFFKGDPSYTEILKQGSVEAVNLANNHSYDYMAQGYQDTVSNLNQAGILSFGYDNKAVASANGIKIGMLGYNLVGRLNINSLQNQIASDIEQMKEDCQLVIVSFHWGIEGSKVVTKQQSALGHFVIDSGADLVLGHHPHVIQKVENYNDKYIVYSLGNFCFGGNHNPSDKDTFIFQQSFVFNQDDICVNASQIKIIPCSVSSMSNRNNFCPTPVEGETAQRILQRVGLPAN
jgi:poly-gamma-glutamate capsule biosynthesis protein CapA/YwtB (metallophosphatase superfamily)